MLYKVKITPAAISDIRQSSKYYNLQQRGLGKRFTITVNDTIEAIRKMPERASIAYEDVRYKLVHKFPFVIIYKIEGTIVIVLRVFHTSRKPIV